MLESITDADLARWVWTPVRYCILAIAAVQTSQMSRDAACDRVEGIPRMRESFLAAGMGTLICWVVGTVSGVMWPIWYTDSGPVWHRLLAAVIATYLAGIAGYLEGIRLWHAKNPGRRLR